MLHAAQYMDSNGIMIFNNERRNEVSDNAFQKHSKYKIFRRKASEWMHAVLSYVVSEYSRKELVNGACAEAMQAESDSNDTLY